MIIPLRITRAFIQATPHINFIFGDNLEERGYGGQSKEARDEPNAYGIPTKVRPCMLYYDAFFNDYTPAYKEAIDKAISEIPRDKQIILFPKIGTGFSEMNTRAPILYAYMIQEIQCKLGYMIINKDTIA